MQVSEPRGRSFLAWRRLAVVLAYLVVTLFVLYPNPALLGRAVANATQPRVDPDAVQHWAAELPDDPAYIERQVLDHYVPYAVPWQTHGVPWYFPTTREVVEQGAGDCQARMLVFASILEAKGIPYQLRASLDHIWVEYPQKQESRLENAAIAILDGDRLQVPERWDWRETYRIEKEYFWDPMPTSRLALLLTAWLVIALRRPLHRLARGVFAELRPARPASSRV